MYLSILHLLGVGLRCKLQVARKIAPCDWAFSYYNFLSFLIRFSLKNRNHIVKDSNIQKVCMYHFTNFEIHFCRVEFECNK